MCKKRHISITMLVMSGIIFFGSCNESNMSMSQKFNPANDWQLGMQAYTFRMFTFYEAIDKTAELGLKYIEGYPEQQVSADRPDVTFNYDILPEIRNEVKEKLAQAGVKLVSYGVVHLPNDEAACRKVFDFAKDMGIETIVSEPPYDAFDVIDKLCAEYKINVAIHNHPKRERGTSRYWNPDTVVTVCKDRSSRIGACADIGHWVRSGLDAVECLKKLEGRIITMHFKDVDESGIRFAHDVVWGTGVDNTQNVMAEMARQKFKGYVMIEYERESPQLMDELRQCIQYFNKQANQLNRAR